MAQLKAPRVEGKILIKIDGGEVHKIGEFEFDIDVVMDHESDGSALGVMRAKPDIKPKMAEALERLAQELRAE